MKCVTIGHDKIRHNYVQNLPLIDTVCIDDFFLPFYGRWKCYPYLLTAESTREQIPSCRHVILRWNYGLAWRVLVYMIQYIEQVPLLTHRARLTVGRDIRAICTGTKLFVPVVMFAHLCTYASQVTVSTCVCKTVVANHGNILAWKINKMHINVLIWAVILLKPL